MAGSRNGKLIKWVSVILFALVILGSSFFALFGTFETQKNHDDDIDTQEKILNEIKTDQKDIQTDIKELLKRSN